MKERENRVSEGYNLFKVTHQCVEEVGTKVRFAAS